MKTTPFCIDGPLIYDGPIDITVRSRPGVIYYNQDFSGLSLTNASLTDTTFANCNMAGCNLRWTKANNVLFTGCNLSALDTFCADFTKVRFTNSALDGAELKGTRFRNCDLGEFIANASLLGSVATSETPLPSGLWLAPYVDRLGKQRAPGLFAIEYDFEYLSQFTSVDAIETLLAEHPDISLTHLIACLHALSPSYT